ncbi:unnamed protein product [Acanthoscelides obtectus]|uniref:Uncharacterized protein n=1 Tax=Acanthoscelides obtectus TaxID=200917 RepID=A0A9P0Q916_ACAOB|nr:unnamed protein product [Acanthoscelides obtectus]CAK1625977.1 hypothetical protein AOBTE_LOCUS3515 [Acanthoscelides obtectus]
MHFDYSSIVRPNIIALKLLGFWKSSCPTSLFNTIWYSGYVVGVTLLEFFFEGTGFLFLYDKWESLSLVDINSVIFIYSTGMLNLMMMLTIYFHIEPKSQHQFEDVIRWKATARLFQKVCGKGATTMWDRIIL